MHQARHKFFRKDDILHINGIHKERSNLLIPEACDAATYPCDEECEPAVLLGKTDELIYIWFDGFHTTLHGRDGVCLAMQTNAFAPYGTKPFVSLPCSTATMCASQIAAKYEYLVLFQSRNPFGGISSVVHNSHILFNTHNFISSRLAL